MTDARFIAGFDYADFDDDELRVTATDDGTFLFRTCGPPGEDFGPVVHLPPSEVERLVQFITTHRKET